MFDQNQKRHLCKLDSGGMVVISDKKRRMNPSDVLMVNDSAACDWQVNLSWSNTMKKPADEVALRVATAESASLVWILVVNKATQWTGSHDDITKETVRKALVYILSITVLFFPNASTYGECLTSKFQHSLLYVYAVSPEVINTTQPLAC